MKLCGAAVLLRMSWSVRLFASLNRFLYKVKYCSLMHFSQSEQPQQVGLHNDYKCHCLLYFKNNSSTFPPRS